MQLSLLQTGCCSRGVSSVFVFCVKTEGCGVGVLLGRKDFVVAAPHFGLDPLGKSRPLLSSACMSRLRTLTYLLL